MAYLNNIDPTSIDPAFLAAVDASAVAAVSLGSYSDSTFVLACPSRDDDPGNHETHVDDEFMSRIEARSIETCSRVCQIEVASARAMSNQVRRGLHILSADKPVGVHQHRIPDHCRRTSRFRLLHTC